MLENLTTVLTKLIIDNMSTPAQKLKTVLDYLLSQNATLHDKYVKALSDDKADKEAILKANEDKATSVVALEGVSSLLTEVKNELAKAKDDYTELQIKYDELLKQVNISAQQKQDQIDELYVTLQSYIDKLPADINAEVVEPVVVIEVPAEAPPVEAPVEEVVEEVTAPEVVEAPVEEVETPVVVEETVPEVVEEAAPVVEDVPVVTETVEAPAETETEAVVNAPAEEVIAEAEAAVVE